MADQKNLFNEDELKEVIFGALLMSIADKELHENELALIEQFADENWQPEFGDLVQFLKEARNQIDLLVEEPDLLQRKAEDLTAKLTHDLTDEQCAIVQELLGQVMLADNRIDRNEAILLGSFKQKLQIRHGRTG